MTTFRVSAFGFVCLLAACGSPGEPASEAPAEAPAEAAAEAEPAEATESPEAIVASALAEGHADKAHGDGHAHAEGHGHAHGDDATVHHRFDDAARWAKVFDDPARDAWQKPAELVAALDLHPGQVVADIGAGTGYFNRKLARAVGPDGRLIAVDVEPTLIEHMTARAARELTPNVEARLGAFDDPGLADDEVDLVLLVDTYHHIDDRRGYFGRLLDAMKPGGRLVVVDFKPGDLPVGPPPQHRISVVQVTDELTRAGWELQGSPDLLPYQFVRIYGVAGDVPAAASHAGGH